MLYLSYWAIFILIKHMKRVMLLLSNMIYRIYFFATPLYNQKYSMDEDTRYWMRSISIVSHTMLDKKKKPPQFFKKDFCVEFWKGVYFLSGSENWKNGAWSVYVGISFSTLLYHISTTISKIITTKSFSFDSKKIAIIWIRNVNNTEFFTWLKATYSIQN